MSHELICSMWLQKPCAEDSVCIVVVQKRGQDTRQAYISTAPDELAMKRLQDDPRTGVELRKDQLLILLKHLNRQDFFDAKTGRWMI